MGLNNYNNKEDLGFDGLDKLSSLLSSLIINTACKISDIVDFCGEQKSRLDFLIEQKRKYNKEKNNLGKLILNKVKSILDKLEEAIILIEESRKEPSILLEEKKKENEFDLKN